MFDKKGFSLIEIIVVLVIIAILSAIAIPNFINYTEKSAAQAAQNNLITIFNAEKIFYLNNNYYCTTSTQNTTCATPANLNTNLFLNISDSYFSYSCIDPNSASDGNNGSSFKCTATNLSDNTFYLTVVYNPNPAVNITSIILPGATNCPGAACNPTCTYPSNLGFCPS